MNCLVYHIASGQSFFTGVVLVIIAAVASTRSNPIAKRVVVLTFLLGAIAIAISSTAIPYWYYAVAVCGTAAWAISGWVKKWRRWTPFAVIAAWGLAAAIEAPYHIAPTVRPAPSRALTVVGDSITAGLGDDDKSERWPEILAREHNLEVQDISHVGETTALALQTGQGSRNPFTHCRSRNRRQRSARLDFIRSICTRLGRASRPRLRTQRQVLMFELPLPPFNHEYGRIQRSLARKYNVSLVPKRFLLSILAASDSTVDTIHLTQAGQRRMAACVWRLLSAAFPEESYSKN